MRLSPRWRECSPRLSRTVLRDPGRLDPPRHDSRHQDLSSRDDPFTVSKEERGYSRELCNELGKSSIAQLTGVQ